MKGDNMTAQQKSGNEGDKLIVERTDAAVSTINDVVAGHWLQIGERVAAYVDDMVRDFGTGRNWHRTLGEHEGSLHKPTMLRTYHAAWRTWGKLSDDAKDGLKAITITHFAQVIHSRYTDELRQMHLEYAAANHLTVSQFKAYLKGKRVDAVEEARRKKACRRPSANATDSGVSTDWSAADAALVASLDKVYEQLVTLPSQPSEALMTVKETLLRLLRLAITQGLITSADIREASQLASPESGRTHLQADREAA